MSAARLLFYIKPLFRKGRVENYLSEEVQFHLQREIEKNIKAGMSPDEATSLLCEVSTAWIK